MTNFTDTVTMQGEDIEVYDSAPVEGAYTAVPSDQLEEFQRNMAEQAAENARLAAELAAAKEAQGERPAGPRDVTEIEAELAALEDSLNNGDIDAAEYREALEAAQAKDAPPAPERPADPNAGKSPAEAMAEADAIYAKAANEDWPPSKLNAALVEAGVISPSGGGPAYINSGIFSGR